jgi:hypothetical protein
MSNKPNSITPLHTVEFIIIKLKQPSEMSLKDSTPENNNTHVDIYANLKCIYVIKY